MSMVMLASLHFDAGVQQLLNLRSVAVIIKFCI